jgi:predicted secreted protein
MPEPDIVNLKLNDEFILDLTGMGNVGYTWVHEADHEGVVTISHEYIVPLDPKPGERGIERFTIRGVHPGSCTLVFRQIQSWEKDNPPFSVKEIRVNVD